MPGIVPLGKLFFSSFFERFLDKILPVGKNEPVVSLRLARVPSLGQLIVGRIIRPKLRGRREYLIALDGNATMPARSELIFVRVGRDDSGVPRG